MNSRGTRNRNNNRVVLLESSRSQGEDGTMSTSSFPTLWGRRYTKIGLREIVRRVPYSMANQSQRPPVGCVKLRIDVSNLEYITPSGARARKEITHHKVEYDDF